MYIVAWIPARATSKRLHHKNFRPFWDGPLYTWSMGAARNAAIFKKIIIDTDEPGFVYEHGDDIEVWDRKGVIAEYDITTWQLLSYRALKHTYVDVWVVLQPTSPLRTAKDIVLCTLAALGSSESSSILYSYTEGNMGAPNGAVYVASQGAVRPTPELSPIYEMPPERSIDINTEEDWQQAEGIIRRNVKH